MGKVIPFRGAKGETGKPAAGRPVKKTTQKTKKPDRPMVGTWAARGSAGGKPAEKKSIQKNYPNNTPCKKKSIKNSSPLNNSPKKISKDRIWDPCQRVYLDQGLDVEGVRVLLDRYLDELGPELREIVVVMIMRAIPNFQTWIRIGGWRKG